MFKHVAFDEERYPAAHTDNMNAHDQHVDLDEEVNVTRRVLIISLEEENDTRTTHEIPERQDSTPVTKERISEKPTLQPSMNVETNGTTVVEEEHEINHISDTPV